MPLVGDSKLRSEEKGHLQTPSSYQNLKIAIATHLLRRDLLVVEETSVGASSHAKADLHSITSSPES